MDGMDFSGCYPGARVPEGTPPSKRVAGAVVPMAPQESLRRPVNDIRSEACDLPPDLFLTAVQHRTVTPVADTPSEAAIRQLTGPTLAQRHAAMARLDQRLLAVTCGDEQVTDCELLDHMARRNIRFGACQDRNRVELSDKLLADHLSGPGARLARRLFLALPMATSERLVSVPAIARLALRHRPDLFHVMPDWVKKEEVLAPVLKTLPDIRRRNLLETIGVLSPGLAAGLESIEEAIRRDANSSCYRRASELDPALRRLAVEQDFSVLAQFDNLEAQEYGELCDLALQQSGEALHWIRPQDCTEARVDLALAHRQRPGIEDIPKGLYRRDRLRAVLPEMYCATLSCRFLDDWDLWDILKDKPDWLHWLPEAERSEALCHDYLSHFPADLSAVPAPILAAHPEWRARSEQSDVCLPLEEHQRLACCYGPAMANETGAAGAPNLDTQPWALALAPWEHQVEMLPVACKQAIMANGGARGLADLLQAPPFYLEPEALLDQVQEEHCSRRAALLPDQIRKHLLCSPDFRLPREADGRRLIRQIDDHIKTLAAQILGGTLPDWQPVPSAGDWRVRGGRTLVREEDGRCVHMKFLREGEKLAEFGAEEAVQRFAQAHQKRLGFRSEIPQAEGVVFVAQEHLPPAARQCTDPLKVHEHKGRKGYLAFRFTTADNSYDTLAWQPDTPQGGDSRAREGLLRALHDIGVWSSMGAVHTSTIRLYHHFQEGSERPELLLSALFNPTEGYPGKLHLWNSYATEHSDWGWSGLRDLGDLEFYPFVTTYVESCDAHWTLPDYGQRASFVNGIAQNILASLLHIMRLYRATDPDYHYTNSIAVARLGQFVEDGCDALLGGLLGDGTRLEDMFPDSTRDGTAVYPQWRERTATELIYWTARQSLDGDCFAAHFQKEGRPCARLYPGHPRQKNILYGPEHHFTEPGGENLGPHQRKLPLFFLVRGLYMLAKGVADRLADKKARPSLAVSAVPPHPGEEPDEAMDTGQI